MKVTKTHRNLSKCGTLESQAGTWRCDGFAAVASNGQVVCWGGSFTDCYGPPSTLKNVEKVKANQICTDGAVVWGYPFEGGDATEVRNKPIRVSQIQSTDSAFDRGESWTDMLQNLSRVLAPSAMTCTSTCLARNMKKSMNHGLFLA